MSDPSADPYLAERIRTALAQDSRLNELGIQVSLVGNRVFVRAPSRPRIGCAPSRS